jgi:IclR family acetate operon transcriptional repressor
MQAGGDGSGDVPAVARMLDIAAFLVEQNRPYGINELARELKLPVNSVFRILKCLEARGYVEGSGDGYQLSTGFFSLGMRLHARFDLRQRARRHLEHLSRITGETSQIHIPEDGRLLVLDVATPPAPFFLQIVPGTRLEYHTSAFGKAFLAFQSDERVARLVPERSQAFTPNSLTRRDALLKELEATRRTGLSYDREERVVGVYCIGAPVFDVTGNSVAGLGITGLVSRFQAEARSRFEADVLACAENVSKDIGYRGDAFAKFRQTGAK